MKCAICLSIWNNLKDYLLDTKKIFSSEFISENYYKHFGYSLILTIPSILLLMFFAHLADTGVFFQGFLGGFGAFIVNWCREWYYSFRYKWIWDQTDVNMGSYGGLVGALIGIYIFSLLNI